MYSYAGSALLAVVRVFGRRSCKTEIVMSLEIPAGKPTPAPCPIQFVSIELTPILGGKFSVSVQATLLDEQELEFVGQDLANAHVETLDDALAIIRQNVAILSLAA